MHAPRWILLCVALAPPVAAGCAGFFSSSAPTDAVATSETPEPGVDRSDPSAVEARMRVLGELLEGGGERRRAEWSLERATLALDAAVLHEALAATDPLAAERWLDALQAAWPDVDVTEPLWVATRVAADFEAGGAPALRVARTRALLAPTPEVAEPESLWLQWADEDPFLAPRLRLAALRSAMRHFASWARRGSGYGGADLVRECSFLCGPGAVAPSLEAQAMLAGYACPSLDDLPDGAAPEDAGEPPEAEAARAWALPQPTRDAWARAAWCGPERYLLPERPDTPSLLCAENFLDATVLLAIARLIAQVEADRERGEPVAVAATRLIAEASARREMTAIPAVLTPNLFDELVTLDLPRVLLPPDAEDARLLVRAPRLRTLWVHSHELRLAAHPSLRAAALPSADVGFTLEWVDRTLGHAWPGRLVVPMERAGALPTSMVVEGHVEPLANALAAWEAAAAPQIWVPADERHDAAPEVSLFVDGGVYLATLVPIVATLEAAGYGRPLIHAWHTAMQRPVVLPLRVAATVPDDAHLIVVRSDGFLVQPWDPERMDSGDVVTRLESDPLLRLHRLVREQRQSGRLDPERRIAVRVDDLSTDLGTLAHVLLALAWERDLTAIETDAQLLSAPLLRDAGSLRELAGHGITVAPG